MHEEKGWKDYTRNLAWSLMFIISVFFWNDIICIYYCDFVQSIVAGYNYQKCLEKRKDIFKCS